MVHLDRKQRGVVLGMASGLLASLLVVFLASRAFLSWDAPERAGTGLLLPAAAMFLHRAHGQAPLRYPRRYRRERAECWHCSCQDIAILTSKYEGAASVCTFGLRRRPTEHAPRYPSRSSSMRLFLLAWEADLLRNLQWRCWRQGAGVRTDLLPHCAAAHLATRAACS